MNRAALWLTVMLIDLALLWIGIESLHDVGARLSAR